MSDLAKYYQNHAGSYGMPERRVNQILALLNDIHQKKILDVGCGDGSFGKVLEKKGARVFGIDISAQAIKVAKKNLTKAVVTDLNSQKLPFKANSFDVVVASEVIEHLFNPLKLLREMRRVLKPQGVLVITTPNFLYWGHRVKFLKGEFEYQDVGPFDRGHIHFYTYKTLLNDLEKADLRVEQERHLFLGHPLIRVIESFFPSVFAYQLILKCRKNSK